MLLRFFFAISVLCFFNCCAKDISRLKEKKEIYTKEGYIEFLCEGNYFYGDIIANGNDDYLKISIFNFGNEIFSIEDYGKNFKAFYLGSELGKDYLEFVPFDIKFFLGLIKKLFNNEKFEENTNIFFELENEKRVLNILEDKCKVKIFLE